MPFIKEIIAYLSKCTGKSTPEPTTHLLEVARAPAAVTSQGPVYRNHLSTRIVRDPQSARAQCRTESTIEADAFLHCKVNSLSQAVFDLIFVRGLSAKYH